MRERGFVAGDHEQVLTVAHPHWIGLLGPLSALCFAVCVQVAASWYGSTQGGSVSWVWLPGAAAATAALCWLGQRELHRRYTRFTLTTRRAVYETGILSRNHWETPLAAVTSVSVRANLMERALGLGDLRIESPTDSAAPLIGDVPNPTQIRDLILDTQTSAQGPAAPTAARARPDDDF